MGIAETITGVMTGTSPFGRYFPHPMLNEGSLFLFDPTHSLGAFSGVPEHDQVMPNIAHEIAADIIGSGNSTTLGAMASKVGTQGTNALFERTGAGGMHGLFSHVNTGTSLRHLVRCAPLIRDYVWANKLSHDFFFSFWFRVTRGVVANAAPQAPFYCANTTGSYLFHSQGGIVTPSNQLGKRNGAGLIGIASGTPILYNVGTNSYLGTPPGSPLEILGGAGAHGPWGPFNNDAPLGGVIERMYIEDLTVSGRTYAEADALDLELHTAAHAAGGAWYGDTYTNPATFP